MSAFAIELRPLIGEHQDPQLGLRTVAHPLSYLMYHDAELERVRNVHWLHIGWVGHHTDTIEFLPQAMGLGQVVLDEVTAEVEKLTGTKRRQNLPPKAVGTPRKAVKEME